MNNSYDININKKLANKIFATKPDLLVVTLRSIHPILVSSIKSELKNIVAIHINPDALTTFQRQQIFVCPFDFYFTKDPYIARFMREKINLDAFYLPEAFNPRVHIQPKISKQDLEKEINIDVLAFGNLYPYRTQFLKRLIKDGIKVQIFGNMGYYFPEEMNQYYSGEYIIGKRKSEIVYGSRIVFNNFHYAEIEGVNCKYFEINGIGGFQICDYKKIQEKYSTIPPKSYTYNSYEEALSLIKHYLKNPAERYKIAKTQYEHALLHHTYDHRIKSILSIINK